MIEKFAKLYETNIGQILIKIDTDTDDKVEVRFSFTPDGLGVCSVAATMKDASDKSWDSAQEMFDNVTKESAVEFVSGFIEKIAKGEQK